MLILLEVIKNTSIVFNNFKMWKVNTELIDNLLKDKSNKDYFGTKEREPLILDNTFELDKFFNVI